MCLSDDITGESYDFTRRNGVEYTELILPEGVSFDRERLWNAAEASENRKNSTVAREYELALPEELTTEERRGLALEFTRYLVSHYGVAADVAIHAPGKEGDNRNHHAHILTTTRQVSIVGFGAKTRALDDKKTGEVERIREKWADLVNFALERSGHQERVSHKSLEAQGIDREPTTHLGPVATAMERRGVQTERGDLNRSIGEAVAIRAEIAIAEEMHTGLERMEERFEEWRIAQEEAAIQRALTDKREKERRERLEREEKERKELEAKREAERKAREQEQQRPTRPRGPRMGLGR